MKLNFFNDLAIVVRAFLKAQKFWIPMYIIVCFMLFNTGLNLISVASTFKNIIGVLIISIIIYFNYLLLTKKDA